MLYELGFLKRKKLFIKAVQFARPLWIFLVSQNLCKVMPFRKHQLSNLFMQMVNVVS